MYKADAQHEVRPEPCQDLGVVDALLPDDARQKQGGSGAPKKFREAGDHGEHRVSHERVT